MIWTLFWWVWFHFQDREREWGDQIRIVFFSLQKKKKIVWTQNWARSEIFFFWEKVRGWVGCGGKGKCECITAYGSETMFWEGFLLCLLWSYPVGWGQRWGIGIWDIPCIKAVWCFLGSFEGLFMYSRSTYLSNDFFLPLWSKVPLSICRLKLMSYFFFLNLVKAWNCREYVYLTKYQHYNLKPPCFLLQSLGEKSSLWYADSWIVPDDLRMRRRIF